MVTERFLYEIHPHRPIKNLIPGRAIIKPCSMKLTKEEVLTCMNSGPVFRAFPGKDLIRVTGSNLNQLHASEFVEGKISTSEANYTPKPENDARAQEPSPEEPKTEAPTEEKVEENTEPVETEEIVEQFQDSEKDEVVTTVTPGDPITVEAPQVELDTVTLGAFGAALEEALDQNVEEPPKFKVCSKSYCVRKDDGDFEIITDIIESEYHLELYWKAVEEAKEKNILVSYTDDNGNHVNVTEEDEVEETETTETPAPQNNGVHVNISNGKKYYNNKKRH